MKQTFVISVLLLLFTFSMPLISVSGLPASPAVSPGVSFLSAPSPRITYASAKTVDAGIAVRVLEEGSVTVMPMDQYLRGVLAAEMPASFEPEALKAQAVAARTYTLYRIQNGCSAHPEADVCTDSLCCAAYIGEAAAAAAWGENASAYWEKITEAVAETDGMVALYNGTLIDTVFHSSSAGRTEAAVNVWGKDLPYLQSVESPETDATVPNYYSRVEVSVSRFKEAFLAEYPNADLSASLSGWFKNETRSEAGYVISLDIGGVTVSGPAVRSLFSLRSADFRVDTEDGSVVFYVTGYGHGVGMSQYGANVLASRGENYVEILEWYYTGASVERWQG